MPYIFTVKQASHNNFEKCIIVKAFVSSIKIATF